MSPAKQRIDEIFEAMKKLNPQDDEQFELGNQLLEHLRAEVEKLDDDRELLQAIKQMLDLARWIIRLRT